MAIREKIVIDAAQYMSGLSGAEKAAMKFARKQDKLFKQNEQTIQSLQVEINKLKRVRDASNSTESIKKYNKAIDTLERKQSELIKETHKYRIAVKGAEKQTGQSGRNMETSFKRIGRAAKQWIVTIAVAAFAALQRAAGKVASQFQDDFAQVKTLLNETEVDFEALERRLINLSKIKAVPLSVLTPALYQTISAGITDVNEAMEVLSIASDAAIAGNTDVKTSVDGITTALNAWNLEAKEARNVSDEFFVAVRNGKTTFGELSNSIGRVAPLAAATNTELSEVLAATAALTSSGLNTAESMTALRGILQKIIKPTEQAKKEAADLGIEFNQSALEAVGLQGFLQNVAEAANGNSESIGKLFEDVEAFNGVLSLTGSASSAFNKNLGDMEESAGTTDEALKKVEENLSKIWETTKNRVNGVLIRLGKTVLPIVGSALSAFNKTLQEFEDPSQRLINNLEAIGADKSLIVQLQAELDVKKATEQFYEIENELEEISIPVSYEVTSRLVTAQEAARSQGAMVAGQNRVSASVSGELDASKASVEELESGLDNVRERLEEIGRASSNFNDLTKAQQEEVNLLSESQQTLEQVIAARKQQATLQTTIVSGYKAMRAAGKEAKETGEGVAVSTDEQTKSAAKAAVGFHKIETAWVSLGSVVQDGPASIMQTHFDALIDSAESYEQTLRRLDNELELGQISQEKYNKAVEKASAKYLEQLQSTYELFKSKLGPEQQKVFEALIKNLKKTEKEGDKAESSLGDIAESLNSVLSLADAFGDVDENLKNVLRGSVDLLRNLEAMSKLDGDGFLNLGGTGLKGAIPVIGVATSMLTMLSGFIGQNSMDNEERLRELEEMQDLRVSLNSLRRAVIKQTEAYLDQPVVGGDVSKEEYERGEELYQGFFTGDRERGGEPFGYADEETFLTNLSELAELFPEIFGEYEEMYQNLRDQGLSHSEAVARLMREGLGGAWSLIEDSFREYGESIEGAQRMYEDAIRYGAMSTQEAFELFIQQLKEAGLDLSQTVDGKTLGEWMKEFNDPKTTEEEREEIIQMLWNNWEDLIPDSWSYDDFVAWLETLSDYDNSSDESGAGTESEGFSRSVQFNRTITDIQANEVIVLLEWIGEAVWSLVEMAGGERLNFGQVTTNGERGFNIEIPLPVIISNWDEMPFPEGEESGGSSTSTGDNGNDTGRGVKDKPSQNVSIAVQIDNKSGITDDDIDEWSRRMASQIKTEMKNRQF